MTEEKIREVVNTFASEAKHIYGPSLKEIILYGSCARGDFSGESDIDLLILLDVAPEEIGEQRKLIRDMTDRLELDYDVVLAPVLQNADVYKKYTPVSAFYQNIEKDGVKIA